MVCIPLSKNTAYEEEWGSQGYVGEKREYRKVENTSLQNDNWLNDRPGNVVREGGKSWKTTVLRKRLPAAADFGCPGWNTEKSDSNKMHWAFAFENWATADETSSGRKKKSNDSLNLSLLAQDKAWGLQF